MKRLLKNGICNTQRVSGKQLLSAVTLLSLLAGSVAPALAHDRYGYYNNRYNNNYYRGYVSRDQHPYVKKAAIGGGAGALLGGILSPEGSRGDGAIKGALLGAGAGLGYEYLKQKGYIGNGRSWW